MKGMVCETGINAGNRGDGGKSYKSRQICCGCMRSTLKVYFELINGYRFASGACRNQEER